MIIPPDYETRRERRNRKARERSALPENKIKRREFYRRWAKRNVELKREIGRRYHRRHRTKKLTYHAGWRQRNKEKIRIDNADYRKKNRDRIRLVKADGQRRRRMNPHVRLIVALRARVICAVKSQSAGKGAKTMELIGCTGLYLRNHLEAQFRFGMTWENYGKWVVDHIIPCDFFDLTNIEQQKQCFHYSNLQPLWRRENSRKWKFYSPENPEHKTAWNEN